MKLIMENWNKFLNEDADSSIKMVSGYLSGIEEIIQMGYEKYAAQTPKAVGSPIVTGNLFQFSIISFILF